MKKTTFIQTLENLNSIKNIEIREVEELTQNFPYFQLGHQILAKVHSEKETSLTSDKLKISAIYSTSRALLKKLIKSKASSLKPETTTVEIIKENKKFVKPLTESGNDEELKNEPSSLLKIEIQKENKTIETSLTKESISLKDKKNNEVSNFLISKNNEKNLEKTLQFDQPSNYDFLSEVSNINLENLFPKKTKTLNINEFLIPDGLGINFGISESYLGEVILSTKKLEENNSLELVLRKEIIKEPSESTIEIIDTFLDTLPKIKSIKKVHSEDNREDLSKRKPKGITDNITETLANIYLAQGNIKKAKIIFEKLIVLFPEKKAYFAKKLRDINE